MGLEYSFDSVLQYHGENLKEGVKFVKIGSPKMITETGTYTQIIN